MSTVLHPAGPNPPRVYWVRRLVVLVVLGAVVWGLVALGSIALGRFGPDDAAAAAGQTTAAEGAGETAADASDEGTGAGAVDAAEDDAEDAPAAPVDCTPDSLQLALTTDALEYAADADPVLRASITNIGDVPCTVDAGDATREVLITSGADRIWSTKDCAAPETASRQILLGTGAQDPAEITWQRVRSGEGCPAGLPEPRAGTYQAVLSLLGTSAQPAVFTLK
ncbi:hypothetical protein [Cellulomonas fimi]|uniref:DUF4232 domain-containing protein n=1 Tax=Cellulomonas fimi TaxID=1708 RepID=A0A7Y0QH33_CELFI|nr:hypothetical protein [Cellulomonas fimi]NMR18767.1 hypothetical protein [Cellulomonas fimi]